MDIYMVETEKYIVRNLCENDFEDVKALLKENEYLGMLWSTEMLPEDRLDELVRRLYINRDNGYSVVNKKTGEFLGHMSITKNEREGELSVRMKQSVDMYEVVELFGKILKLIGPAEQKNLTIQYCFE